MVIICERNGSLSESYRIKNPDIKRGRITNPPERAKCSGQMRFFDSLIHKKHFMNN